ncbi:MAG: glycine cleavage system protein H [Deltaproteobacteria bacterium]|nr:glycine cleavage system protein H [Deltaproteobacteria bacterium]
MIIEGYDLPDELYYTDEHAWLKVEEGGRVRLGLNDFAQKLAGEISFVKLPKAGKAIEKGKVLFSVQSGKWAGKIKMPVEGIVAEANEALVFEPATVNQDCYGAGWVAVIEASNLAADLAELIHGGEKVAAWLKGEIARHAKA